MVSDGGKLVGRFNGFGRYVVGVLFVEVFWRVDRLGM
jgi:hypothetical protein